MQPGTLAALIVYENTWAIPFVAAAMESGGTLIAGGRIPAQDVMEALDALETLEATIEEPDMPGLLRGIARTAAVAGTATAVAGRVRRRQDAKFAQQGRRDSSAT